MLYVLDSKSKSIISYAKNSKVYESRTLSNILERSTL